MPYVKQRTRIQMHPRGMGQRGLGQQCNWYDISCWLVGNAAQAAAAAQQAADVTQAQQNTSAASGLSLTLTQDYPQGPPTLAPGSVSPGLPTGYNPDTGLISDNTTGATETNPYSVDLTGYPVASGTDASGNPITNPWYCQYFGIGCPGETGTPTWMWAVGLTLGAVVLLNAFGRRR